MRIEGSDLANPAPDGKNILLDLSGLDTVYETDVDLISKFPPRKI